MCGSQCWSTVWGPAVDGTGAGLLSVAATGILNRKPPFDQDSQASRANQRFANDWPQPIVNIRWFA
jgi:hypothetical protein